MRLVLPFLLSLAWLTSAAVIHSLGSSTTELGARDGGTGYRSVAYFVNWVSSLRVPCYQSNQLQLMIHALIGNLRPKLQPPRPPCREADARTVCLC